MDAKAAFDAVMGEVQKKIAGKLDVVQLMFIAMLANGHVMLEGVPGVAKTTMAKTLADTVQAQFGRVQGMPDLDIRDIIGYTYMDDGNQVQLKKGPIFCNVLLIDELNRAAPRTTTSLLEALEERQVTIGSQSMPLPKPFMAIATQNPLNIEGTTSLPKVLCDRFLMRLSVDYASMEDEQQMLRIKEKEAEIVTKKVLTTDNIVELQKAVKEVVVPDDVVAYITRVVGATRKNMQIVMGASPRSEISFMNCAKAKALVDGRKEATIDDIKYLAKPVLSHRIVVRSTGGVGVNGVINGIIATLK